MWNSIISNWIQTKVCPIAHWCGAAWVEQWSETLFNIISDIWCISTETLVITHYTPILFSPFVGSDTPMCWWCDYESSAITQDHEGVFSSTVSTWCVWPLSPFHKVGNKLAVLTDQWSYNRMVDDNVFEWVPQLRTFTIIVEWPFERPGVWYSSASVGWCPVGSQAWIDVLGLVGWFGSRRGFPAESRGGGQVAASRWAANTSSQDSF